MTERVGRLAVIAAVVLAIVAAGTLVFIRARDETVVTPAATHTPVAGVLTPPKGKIPLPIDVSLSAPSRDVVWALVWGGRYLYRSTDRGQRWQQRPLPPGAGWTSEISFVSDREGWMTVTGSPETQCNTQSVTVWHTTDAGATWQNQGSRGIADAQCKLGLSFVDSTHGFIDAWDDNGRPVIYRTSDGGATWAASAPLADPPGFMSQAGGWFLEAWEVRSFGNLLLVPVSQSNPGGLHVYVSRDGGSTWAYTATVPMSAGSLAFITADHWLQLIVPGQSMETTDAGKSWHLSSSDYDQAAPIAPQVVFVDDQVGYATVRGEIKITLDGGEHWAPINTPGA